MRLKEWVTVWAFDSIFLTTNWMFRAMFGYTLHDLNVYIRMIPVADAIELMAAEAL